MSASMTYTSAAVCVRFTIKYTTTSKAPVSPRNSAVNNAARRKLSVRKILVLRKQLVSRAADRLDRIDFRALIELGAQPADMALHDTGLRIEVNVPHVLEQHRARDDAIGVAH